ncbi:MAG: hypothetical protein M1156_00725 [Candidatus Marsarchaeota archaeon]|jgi:hypothetical protein|nr:hypothetical protein [Candidatus Marsarchaeota archaeon]
MTNPTSKLKNRMQDGMKGKMHTATTVFTHGDDRKTTVVVKSSTMTGAETYMNEVLAHLRRLGDVAIVDNAVMLQALRH